MFKRALWGLAIAASLVAMGGIEPASAAPLRAVTEWVVGTYTSTPGETKAEFVHRVAEVLKGWAEQTHTEAGGPFAVKPDGNYTITLTTQKSQIMVVIATTPPPGARLIGETIHDHPLPTSSSGMVRLTAADHAAAASVGDWTYASRSARWITSEPATFSLDDYAGGPGYLVVGSRLLYQHGEGTAVVVDANL